jgi:peptidyl-prolyl cis-trans isomerase D
MITAFQTFLLKHNKWLLSILLVVVIVTFVLTIGNQTIGGGNRTFEVESREFYGYDLNNREDMARIGLHASLSLQLDQMNKIMSSGFLSAIGRMEDYAFVRIAALGLANQLGIPNPTKEELGEFLRTRSAFQRPDGSFDASAYTAFRDRLAIDPQLDENTLGRVLQEDFRIERVLAALGGPGYLLPFEAEKGFLMQETEWTVRIASSDYSAFTPEIVPTEEDLLAYYAENPGNYTQPERVRVSVVYFRAENFLDQVPVTEAALENFFDRNRFRYPAPPPAEGEEAPAEVTLESVRGQVEADYRRAQARGLAQASSEEFVGQLYDEEIPRESPEFDAAVKRFRASLVPLEPYARGRAPTNLGLPAATLQSAWVWATQQRYYSDLAETADGAALIVVEGLLGERREPYEEVAARVREDFLAEERRRLFAAQAAEWEEALDEALAADTPFSAAAESLGFAVQAPEPFKVSSLPAGINARIWDATQILPRGAHSRVVLEENRAVVTYVVNRQLSAADATETAQRSFRENLIEQRQDAGGWFALAEWTNLNLKRLQPDEEAL